MKNLEQIIWNYLDGIVSEEEIKLIERLLKTDAEFLTLFEEIKSIHLQISTIGLEEPSMSFERNLMDKIQLEPNPLVQNSWFDKWFIKGITTFFIATILFLLGILFLKIDWGQSGEISFLTLPLSKITLNSSNYAFLINLFLFTEIILALYFLDFIISKKMNFKSDQKL